MPLAPVQRKIKIISQCHVTHANSPALTPQRKAKPAIKAATFTRAVIHAHKQGVAVHAMQTDTLQPIQKNKVNRLPVNKEAIRILVADIGYEETSKRTGIKAATLRQWAKRKAWNITRQHATQLAVTNVTSASDAHAAALAEHERETRMSLARAARNMSKEAEHAGIKHAGRAHEVAKTAAIIHSWGDQHQRNILNIGILANQVAIKEGD